MPVCTSPKIDSAVASGEINRQIESLLQQGLSIYRVDLDQLRELQPNLILTQTQCDVCAVSFKDVESALAGWTGARPDIISLAPQRLKDVWEDIRRVAEALNEADAGKDLLRSLHRRVADIIEKTCLMKRRPSVACIEWLDPLMAAGNWMPELVELAGGLNLFGDAGKHSPWLNWEAVQEHDPDIIVMMPCGFDLPRVKREMTAITSRPDWHKLRAVKSGRVYFTDGNHYFNRPGPRLVESLEILAEVFHPALFSFGHEQKGWQRWQER